MIVCENLVKKYGKNTVIDNLSFSIADGEKIVIGGRSGIGKTTLLRLISGLERYDSGKLYGYDKKEVSYMFQEPRLLPWETLLSNVSAVKDNCEAEARDLLDKLRLSDDLDKYPDELSGGMKQRTALARALIYDKPILILDEPFASIDEETKKSAVGLIRSLVLEKTVILVSHNADDYEMLFGNDFRLIEIGAENINK